MKRAAFMLSVVPAGLFAMLFSAAAHAQTAQPQMPVAGRWYKLQTAFRGAGECLEGNQSSSPVHGGAAFMDRCQNVSGQLWSLLPVGGAPAPAPPAPPAPAASERPDHRCGPSFANASCAPGRCCSTHEWCGGPQETHCSTDRGFNGRFDGR
jgi:hypothetical protein